MNDFDEKTRKLYERTRPITKEELEDLDQYPDLKRALENLQGNILRGHGRNYSIYIFLCFKKDKQDGIKKWIKELADDITSAHQQLEEAAQYRQCEIPGRLFMSFFLSAAGYKYLVLDPSRFGNEAFLSGMEKAQQRLNDPRMEEWEEGYQKCIHAMVLLADDDESFLRRKARWLLDKVRTHSEICAVEHGRVMRNTQGDSIEHFGFVDSRSQPLFFECDVVKEMNEGDGINVWDPGDGPSLVLVPDPYGREIKDGKEVYYSGSYLVFRKLEQNVRRFKEYEQELAKVLGLTGEDAKRAGALVMGRFEDGTPVALQSTAGRCAPVPNNFKYDDDPHGLKCPFQAHIRKVNPRNGRVPRIVRRGITYGQRKKEPKDNPSLEELPSEGVGILFVCYQRNIEKQFELLQANWANEPRRPWTQKPGIDPVVGQHSNLGLGQQKWPAQWGKAREKHRSFDFYGFVTLKGGEYFFAPSKYFLKKIHN